MTVVDRDLPDSAFRIRQDFSAVLGKGFGRWISSRERGRFLLIQLPASSSAEAMVNLDTEAQLIDAIADRFIQLGGGDHRFIRLATRSSFEARVCLRALTTAVR
jgi:hypothetical protein